MRQASGPAGQSDVMQQRIRRLADAIRGLADAMAGDDDARRGRIDVIAPVNRASSLNVASHGSERIAVRRQYAPVRQRSRDASNTHDASATDDGEHE